MMVNWIGVNRGMRIDAIGQMLGHKTLGMTLIYARIANRTVADEFRAVSDQVDALYDDPDLPGSTPDPAETGEMRRLRLEHRRMLGNGWCTRPAKLDCASRPSAKAPASSKPPGRGDPMGASEIARLLGVSRQRVQQLAQRPDIPEPVVVLDMGKVWRPPTSTSGSRNTGQHRPTEAGDGSHDATPIVC
jgi:hypothetical protein